MKPFSRDLLRLELPWLVAEVVALVVITNAHPSERWFWLVQLLVILGYRIDRFLVVSKGTSGKLWTHISLANQASERPFLLGSFTLSKGVILCGMDSLRILWTRANRALSRSALSNRY